MEHSTPQTPAPTGAASRPAATGRTYSVRRGGRGSASASRPVSAPQQPRVREERPSAASRVRPPGAVSAGAQESAPVRPRSGGARAPASSDHTLSLGETQRRQLVRGTYECVICVSAISRRGRVWVCREGCWTVAHLHCVQQWRAVATTDAQNFRCPVCSKSHRATPEYLCFCGKTRDPDFIPGQTPHCCGEICGRRLACADVFHRCAALCHPGPCADCPVPASAHAAPPPAFPVAAVPAVVAAAATTAAAAAAAASAGGERCGKKLRCGRHRCVRPAGTCADEADQTHSFVHECLQLCDKALACGLHRCDLACHLGKCPPCVRLEREVRECPCGQTRAARRLRCGESQTFTCANVCGKVKASCGVPAPASHRCGDLCHYGPCGLCVELVDRVCAGGHRLLLNRPCHVKNSSCGAKCLKPLPSQCGHLCKAVCHAGLCDAAPVNACVQPCELLSRGNPGASDSSGCGHACGAPCHGGAAAGASACPVESFPCPAKVVSLCECGLRSEETPCGALVGGKAGANARTLPCTPACETAVRQAGLKAAFLAGSPQTSGTASASGSVRYFEHLLELGERWSKNLLLVEQIFSDAVTNKTNTPAFLPSGCVGRRALATEYAQVYWRLDVGSSPGGQVWVRVSSKSRKPPVLLSDVLASLSKEQRAPWTLTFDELSPCIFVYDVPRASDTPEKIPLVLEEFIGEFRVRRSSSRELFIDFTDAEKALRAFRRLKANELDSNLKRCELRNVPLAGLAAASD